MALLDLLGRRWALRILWEIRESRLTFRALQTAAGGISPTVLNRRLQELRAAGIIAHVEGEGFSLTDQGRALMVALRQLNDWAAGWTPSPD